MGIEIQNRDAALQLVSSVARMAAQAGEGVEKKAGRGYVGMINGFTVKLATHYKERHTSAGKAELQQSCDELRTSLKSAVDLLTHDAKVDDKVLKQIYKNLGLDAQGKELKGKPLITRTMALAVANDIKKIVNDENFDHKMANVRGEKTITHSRADLLTESLKTAQEERNRFLNDTLKPLLAAHLAGGEDSPKFKELVANVAARLIIKTDEVAVGAGNKAKEGKGMLAVQGMRGSLDQMDEAAERAAMNGGNGSLESCLATICRGNVATPEFRDAVAVLYRKTVATKAWNADVEDKLAPKTVQVPETKVPEIKLPPPGVERSFAIFKHLVSILPSTNRSFQGWLAAAAAEECNKKMDELTLNDLKGYVVKHHDKTPEKLDAKIEYTSMGKLRIPDFRKSLGEYFKDVLKEGTIADDAKFAELLAQAVHTEGEGKTCRRTPNLSEAEVFYRGGGLFATNEEKFELNGGEVTSVVTPKRKYEKPELRAVLTNFAQTQVMKDGKTLFTALRFGSCALMGLEDDEKRATLERQHYGQLVEQMLLSNQELLNEGLKTGKVELPVCRVDMAGNPDLARYAKTYEIKVGDKTVTVTPKVMHFRIATDSGFKVKDHNTSTWRAMSSADMKSTDKALNQLLAAAENSKDEQVCKLKEQLKSFWGELKKRHCDEQGALRLFEGYGAVMMKFGARISLLAHRLGNVPSYNCNGGRDRTGLMDVECKTLALWLDAGKELPEIAPGADEMTEWRTEVREKSGNQAIARQIKLNDHDMYLMQVGGQIQSEYTYKAELPNVLIPKYDGSGKVNWKESEFSSGLREMFKTNEA